MNFKNILVEKQDAIGFITLNTPANYNTITSAMVAEIAEGVAFFESDSQVRVILLQGGKDAFSSGMNLQELNRLTGDKNIQSPFFDDKWFALDKCRKPVIGLVSGYTFGAGMDLLLMCDFVIAADTARFGYPDITVGLVSGTNGFERLVQKIGPVKAADMVLTGKVIDADQAFACGLVSRKVPVSLLEQEGLEVAARISSFSGPACVLAKKALRRALKKVPDTSSDFFDACMALEDTREGILASLEKRPAAFKNK
jgi:enoyl-CoA hydratase